jgi:hypothetical protein
MGFQVSSLENICNGICNPTIMNKEYLLETDSYKKINIAHSCARGHPGAEQT